jgi:hypothetical protein
MPASGPAGLPTKDDARAAGGTFAGSHTAHVAAKQAHEGRAQPVHKAAVDLPAVKCLRHVQAERDGRVKQMVGGHGGSDRLDVRSPAPAPAPGD